MCFKGRWKVPSAPSLYESARLLPARREIGDDADDDDAVPLESLPLSGDQFVSGRPLALHQPAIRDVLVFLPREKDGLREFLGSLDHQHWKDWTAGFKPTEGTIFLPKFQLRYGNKLNDALSAMGMAEAFNPQAAYFSEIAANSSRMEPWQPLYISDVEHKTFVKIDELGTEAAAASAVVVMIPLAAVGSWPPPFQMIPWIIRSYLRSPSSRAAPYSSLERSPIPVIETDKGAGSKRLAMVPYRALKV